MNMSCCSNCASVTKYICLMCERPVCNKSSDCSVWADEETPGWKAGIAVAWCLPCFDKRNAAENLIGDEEFKEEEPVKQTADSRQLAKRFACGKTQIARSLLIKRKLSMNGCRMAAPRSNETTSKSMKR